MSGASPTTTTKSPLSPSRRASTTDPAWYENEFRMDREDDTAACTIEDDPLALDGALIVSNGSGGALPHPYPIGNNNNEEEGGEADEIIQGKDVGGVGKHQVRRYLCFSGMLLLVVLVVVVPIAVVVPRNKQQQQAGSSSVSGGNNDTPLYLNPPSSDLAAWCQLEDDPRCQEECARADCCRIPAGIPGACLDAEHFTTGLVCNAYMQACSSGTDHQGDDQLYYDDADTGLFQNFTQDENSVDGIPEAPFNLVDLCNPSSFESNTGVRLCAKYCAPARCCWGGVSAPAAGAGEGPVKACGIDEPKCDGYAPCAWLLAHNNVGSEVEKYVEQACNPSVVTSSDLGRQGCVDACSVASCCFVVDSAEDVYTDEDQCFGKPDGFCEQYLSCVVLLDLGLPSDFNPFENAQNYEIPEPPINLAALCDPSVVYTNVGVMQQCQDACSVALCCYLPSLGPDSCLDTHLQVCSQYRAYCDAVFSNQDDSLLDQADDISDSYGLDEGDTQYLLDVCSPDSLSTPTGLQECSAQCSPAACCFSAIPAQDQDEENCRLHNTCTDYQLCRMHENCDTYAPCLNLQNLDSAGSQQISDNIASTVAELCSDLSTQQGVANCQSVCLQHSCCFKDGWNCTAAISQGGYGGVTLESMVASCQDYGGCSGLFKPNAGSDLWTGGGGGEQLDELAAGDLAAACDESRIAANDVDDCVEVCGTADCCELPENVQGSCLMNNYDTCMLFHKECSVLMVGVEHNDEAEVPEVTNSAELIAFCSVASLSTDYGRGRCKDLCSNGKCCWSTDLDATAGEISCRDNPNCPEYSPCLALAASETVNQDISNQVEATCSVLEAQDERARADIALCRSVCIQHRCCWYNSGAGEEASTCFGTEACSQYDGCKWLIDNPP